MLAVQQQKRLSVGSCAVDEDLVFGTERADLLNMMAQHLLNPKPAVPGPTLQGRSQEFVLGGYKF